MRTVITEQTLFQFSELSETAKETALNACREFSVSDSFWHESVIEDAKEIGKLIGIDISRIYFSGFWSQGDGACFEGYYSYAKNGAKKVKEYAPMDKELHSIAERLQDIQRKHFYLLSANVKQSGHYYHSGCTEISLYNYSYSEAEQRAEDELTDLLREFMDWIYSRLESEYNYLTSDLAVMEMIEANGYEFDENGNLN